MNLLPAQTMSGDNRIHVADLFALCDTLPSGSVDMILCDLPYGTTACKWDQVIPFAPMWARFKRIIKPRGAIVLTASQPFTSALVMSNPQMFRYEWIWDKGRGSNYQLARTMPMKSHENTLVFGITTPNYFPQYWYSTPYKTGAGSRGKGVAGLGAKSSAAIFRTESNSDDGRRYPLSIISEARDSDRLHPTQKPVALFEYLIRTYTQAGELVFDPCVGSGTTAVACVNTGRRFICGDQSAEYVAIARERVRKASEQPQQLAMAV